MFLSMGSICQGWALAAKADRNPKKCDPYLLGLFELIKMED
jgi:hypothetical protein